MRPAWSSRSAARPSRWLPDCASDGVVAAEPIVQRLADVKMQMDYGASVLSQWTFARFLTNGMYDEYVAGLKRELRHRRDRALVTLQRKWTGVPTGTCRPAASTFG